MKISIATLLLAILFAPICYGQTNNSAKDYLNVPGPISFDKSMYYLAWTSHPTSAYYKQEYIAKGDSLVKFKRLMMLEVITGNLKIKDIVASKIAELKRMKATNPVVNYEKFEKNGEVMLDFVVSENSTDGKHISILERNIYRYKSITVKNGQKGILLFGVSDRSYGDAITKFLADLKQHRSDLVNLLGAFSIPEITISQ